VEQGGEEKSKGVRRVETPTNKRNHFNTVYTPFQKRACASRSVACLSAGPAADKSNTTCISNATCRPDGLGARARREKKKEKERKEGKKEERKRPQVQALGTRWEWVKMLKHLAASVDYSGPL
jgi:hypothetical protein